MDQLLQVGPLLTGDFLTTHGSGALVSGPGLHYPVGSFSLGRPSLRATWDRVLTRDTALTLDVSSSRGPPFRLEMLLTVRFNRLSVMIIDPTARSAAAGLSPGARCWRLVFSMFFQLKKVIFYWMRHTLEKKAIFWKKNIYASLSKKKNHFNGAFLTRRQLIY